jgi:hypothetical protein
MSASVAAYRSALANRRRTPGRRERVSFLERMVIVLRPDPRSRSCRSGSGAGVRANKKSLPAKWEGRVACRVNRQYAESPGAQPPNAERPIRVEEGQRQVVKDFAHDHHSSALSVTRVESSIAQPPERQQSVEGRSHGSNSLADRHHRRSLARYVATYRMRTNADIQVYSPHSSAFVRVPLH